MRSIITYIAVFSLIFFNSCEEKIDIDLNDSDPRIVIEANLTNEDRNQEILVSRTVNFDSPEFDQVDNASVVVKGSNGRNYTFTPAGNGIYTNNNFFVNTQITYTLEVTVDNKTYSSKGAMVDYVEIDSMGVTKENIFNEDYYFVNLKFKDPKGVPNYYLYTVSINDGPFKFNAVQNDKFNDGQEVTHQIGGRNDEFKVGDKVKVRRQIVSKELYTYWNEYQLTNPGSAAPGNPTGNISNGALGYFGISNVRDYTVTIADADNDDLE